MHTQRPIPMTKSILISIAVSFTLLLGCGQADTGSAAVAGVERVVKEVAISTGVPVATADLSISGMSCEMMCGGAIKKALATLGVEATEIKMSEDESPDHAIVTYDDRKVTDAEMINAIQALYDGQYKVMAVSIVKQVRTHADATGEIEQKSERRGMRTFSSSEVVLPSILAILTRILR